MLGSPKFIIDNDLHPLCRALRILGFDTLFRGNTSIKEVIRSGIEDHRIWVRKDVEGVGNQYGIRYFLVHSDDEAEQLKELEEQYSLSRYSQPFSCCIKCNLPLEKTSRADVKPQIPQRIYQAFAEFYICAGCGRVYWQGSHWQKMKEKLSNWGW